jgi:membrane fusion protein (multidrug efflux system)
VTLTQVRDAEIQLSYTEIASPIDGRIGRAAVSPGNIVGPDTGVLATVVRED